MVRELVMALIKAAQNGDKESIQKLIVDGVGVNSIGKMIKLLLGHS